MQPEFPPRLENKVYLTEGGSETEIMYKWGFELPEFAMYPLLDNPEADEIIRNMFRVLGSGLAFCPHSAWLFPTAGPPRIEYRFRFHQFLIGAMRCAYCALRGLSDQCRLG